MPAEWQPCGGSSDAILNGARALVNKVAAALSLVLHLLSRPVRSGELGIKAQESACSGTEQRFLEAREPLAGLVKKLLTKADEPPFASYPPFVRTTFPSHRHGRDGAGGTRVRTAERPALVRHRLAWRHRVLRYFPGLTSLPLSRRRDEAARRERRRRCLRPPPSAGSRRPRRRAGRAM